VGQYVSRSVDKILDLQAVVQAFGREGKNRVVRKQAIAPCWIIVTSQEKLNEVVDSKKIEPARLQDRFPLPIDLKQSEPKKCWQALDRGDYDWSHMAMAYRPDRVKEKCKENKS
jgi:hypothetical protein